MAWSIKGELIETCSCNMFCPCWYGVQDLMVMDEGWCGTAFLFRIHEGNAGDIDLGGCNIVVHMHFPGPTLFDGQATARVYVDDRTSEGQQQALETIFQAKQGGPFEVPASLTSTWLPTSRVRIDVAEQNGTVRASVDGVGEIVSERLVNEQGEQVTMQNAAFALVFQLANKTAELAPSKGTSWHDSDMPMSYEGKSGAVGQITWTVDA
jgi:hypothetical protein